MDEGKNKNKEKQSDEENDDHVPAGKKTSKTKCKKHQTEVEDSEDCLSS